MDVAGVRQWIVSHTGTNPGLSSDEIEGLLGNALHDPLWRAEQEYPAGSIITADDRRWEAYSGGISGTSAPTWTGSTVTDGGVSWIDIGDPAWDLNRAAAEGWEIIAAKLAGGFDFSMEGGSWSRSQAHKHALDMANRYWAMSGSRPGGGSGGLGMVTVEPPDIPYRVKGGTLRRAFRG